VSLYYDWQGNPIDLATWAQLFNDERHLGEDELDGVRVSTVWIGIDHGFGRTERPLLFETMIFGGTLDGDTWRYATEAEARAGHARACSLVRLEAEAR
jgi:hypothetical protein